MHSRKVRLLALHGKGTSARIMKSQIKPIIDLLGDVVEVHYMDGGEISAPYQGIESIFPKESYYAWYQHPSRNKLRAAHARIAEQVSPEVVASLRSQQKESVAISMNYERQDFGILTPPETPTFSSSSAPFFRMFPCRAESHAGNGSSSLDAVFQKAPIEVGRGSHGLGPGVDTPASLPSPAGTRTPLHVEPFMYDGLICFSQGCAVCTGLLLEMQNNLGCAGRLPVRLAILMCGGRPFDANGTMERVDATKVAPISIRSIHIHGRQDAGLEESRKLASLYVDADKEVLELDIGHCPPRRSSDVEVVVAAIRRAISELK